MLPNPMWSTICALKYFLADMARLNDATPEVRSEIMNIGSQGFQVEWREFPSYIWWACAQESAELRSDVHVKVHLVDSGLNLLSMVQACLGKSLSEAHADYAKALRGKVGDRRIRDVLYLLKNVCPAAMHRISAWRRKNHFALAN